MNNRTILVVEDNELNMKLVEALLQQGAYSMLQTDNAEDGIQLAQKHCPDLILMDIQLPGMDGLTATQKLKADDSTKGVSIIALTSHAMNGDEEKALTAGCDGFIPKPIDTRTFLETLNQYLK